MEIIKWLLNWFITDSRWFGNNNRGQIDIGWTISPALSELAPTVMSKIYESSSNTVWKKIILLLVLQVLDISIPKISKILNFTPIN